MSSCGWIHLIYLKYLGPEEYDVNDLPNTPENIKKKRIVRDLGIKYERSYESGHIYHDQEGYFKQVK